MANCLLNERCKTLLVRLKRHQRVHTLILGVVRCHFLVEMKLCRRAAVLTTFLDYGYGSVIARCFDRKSHQAPLQSPLQWASCSEADSGLEQERARPHTSLAESNDPGGVIGTLLLRASGNSQCLCSVCSAFFSSFFLFRWYRCDDGGVGVARILASG